MGLDTQVSAIAAHRMHFVMTLGSDRPDWHALAMFWAWSVIHQEQRLRDAQLDSIAPHGDVQVSREWWETETRYRLSFERHALVNAGHHLLECMASLTLKGQSPRLREDTKLLRDAMEHMDDPPKEQYWQAKWANRGVEDHPTSLSWDHKGATLIGGLVETSQLLATARRVIAQVHPRLKARGFPDPPSSWAPAPRPARRGASVALTGLWVHDGDDFSDFIVLDLIDGETHEYGIEGHPNPFEQLERHRAADGSIFVEFRCTGVRDEQVEWLEARLARVVMIRDPHGRVVFGRYADLNRSVDGSADGTLTIRLTIDPSITPAV